MNKVILLGRLTKNVETRYTQTNNALVATFTLAVNRKFAREGEERQADFINIVAWGKTGEFSSKYFKKGLQVAVIGRLQNRSYENNSGQKKYITEVIAEEVYFADSNNRQTADTSILNSPVNTQTEDDGIFSSDDELPF
ncbi:MAG: single-stranded DNA-binding protein [Clostridia bacterium]